MRRPLLGIPLRKLFLGPACGVTLALSLLTACGAGGAASSGRYPEQKRPPAPRSASDGEVLGAHQQDPADTLEGSLTNEHLAPSSPHAEEPAGAAVPEPTAREQCVEASQAAAAPPGSPLRSRPICPPRQQQTPPHP